MNTIGQPHFTEPAAAYTVMESVMLRVEYARWDQRPADLRELSMSASHPRTRERFLALYEITQESCATEGFTE